LSTTQNTRSADLYGLLGHDLFDQRGERDNPGGVLAPAVGLGAVHVVGGQVGDRAAAVVVVIHPHRAGLTRRQGGVAPTAGLDGRLLVGGDHIVVRAQRCPVPGRLVEVEHLWALAAKSGSVMKIHGAPRGARSYPRCSRDRLEGISLGPSDDSPGCRKAKGTAACQKTGDRVQV